MVYERERLSLQKTVGRMLLVKCQGGFYTKYNEKTLKDFYIETQNTPKFPKTSFLWPLNQARYISRDQNEGGKTVR